MAPGLDWGWKDRQGSLANVAATFSILTAVPGIDRRSIVLTMSDMDVQVAAKCLFELGNPARLKAYRLLVRAGTSGLTVGEIKQQLKSPASTLSHHIAHLVSANLITQTREGRTQRCRVRFETMDRLLVFLTTECCAGLPVLEPAESLPI